MKTPSKNDYSRRSNTIDYILIAIGCGLILYGTIDYHFFSKRMRAERDAIHRAFIESIEQNTKDLERLNAELESLNADIKANTAKEK